MIDHNRQKGAAMNNDKHLDGQPRPTAEQVAWVFSHIRDHAREPGSFRHLIYQRMRFDCRAYSPLYGAGGLEISNMCHAAAALAGEGD